MNDQDVQLHDRLAAISDDAPTAAAVLRTVQGGYRRQLRRRRWYATGSVVVVVLVVTGVTTLLGPGRLAPLDASAPTATATATATLGSRASASTTVLALDSQLTPFAGIGVTSPVSVPASWVSYDHNGPDVVGGPTSLQVNWAGQEPTARQTTDVRSGTTGTGQYRGYLITAERPAVTVYAPGYDARATSKAITVNGHPAQLLSAPKGSFDKTYATPAQSRIAWQLGNGQWIQVWAVGESDSVLAGFASSITEVPKVFPADLSIGLTLRGYTAATSRYSSFVSQMAGPGVTLCRPASSAAPASSPVSSPAPASAPASSPDTGNCLDVSANVADGGFGAGIVMGDESNAQFLAQSIVVDVGGVRVHVNARYQASWTTWGEATIVVQSPGGVTMSSADLAALAASVRLSPALGVRNEPNPLVESSLAQQSAAVAGQSVSTR
jgi:hypothetical protein